MVVSLWIGKFDRELNLTLSSDRFILIECDLCRFPPLMYTAQGKDTTERLWKETSDEFDFADVRGILESMGKN